MSRAIILGGRGNLGSQILKLIPQAISWDRADFDATDFAQLYNRINSLENTDLIINCIAYNDLDKAESDPQLANLLNAELPKQLAKICKDRNLALIHFSTGYIFDGTTKTEHDESSTPNPSSVYAKSKLLGEQNILKNCPRAYIIRTNVLFGPKGSSDNAKPSVVDTLLEIGQQTKLIKGITDELSNFTYTPDLAQATIDLITSKAPPDIYHITNSGYGSWYDLAIAIFQTLNWNISDTILSNSAPAETIAIIKIVGSDYPRKAKRPKSSVLKNTKLLPLRPWQQALQHYLINSH